MPLDRFPEPNHEPYQNHWSDLVQNNIACCEGLSKNFEIVFVS